MAHELDGCDLAPEAGWSRFTCCGKREGEDQYRMRVIRLAEHAVQLGMMRKDIAEWTSTDGFSFCSLSSRVP